LLCGSDDRALVRTNLRAETLEVHGWVPELTGISIIFFEKEASDNSNDFVIRRTTACP